MLLFNKESLSLGKKTLQLMKDYKLKYGNTELPHDVDEIQGYHITRNLLHFLNHKEKN